MHRTVHLALAVAVSGALVATGAPSATAATDKSPPRVRDIAFSRTSVAVRGLAVVPVRVSMRVSDPSGVTATPRLALSPVPGHQGKLWPVLTRTSGTATDGVWSATVNVPSTWNGVVRVVAAGAAESITAVRGPALRVRGTHRPALSFTYSALATGGFRIHGRATYTDTGRAIKRLPLATAYDSNCDLEGGGRNDITTDSRGYYEKLFPRGEEAAAGCVALIGPAARNQTPAVLAYRIASAPAYSVPAAAMLRSEDLNLAETTTVTDDYWSALRPPQPCGPSASAGLRRAERAVQAMVGVGERPTVVVNDVAVYQGDGARRYFRELRMCAGWTVLDTGLAGDESVLLRRREHIDYAGVDKDTFVVVARTGRVLVVVADTGWETMNGHEALVRMLSVAAVRRAAAAR
jgi:hypothetical protein